MDTSEFDVVTGAFGYTGKYITSRLLSSGRRVRTVTGHPNRPNLFGDRVEVAPFNFDRPDELSLSLEGAATLFNTYWIRFPYGRMTYSKAVDNSITLIRAAEKAGVKVAAIFQGRFGTGAQTVKAALDAGRFGRLVLASAYVKWHRTVDYYKTAWKGTWELDGGGALMNQAIHGVDLLQWFAGLPTEVSGRFTRRVHTGIQADDTTVATLQYPDGALGTIEASTALWPGWSRRIELCGEHGSISLEDDLITKWDFAKPEPGDDA